VGALYCQLLIALFARWAPACPGVW
jgi:hypothetical protein